MTFAMLLSLVPTMGITAGAETIFAYTIVLKDGKAYADNTSGTDITADVATKGLSYTAATETTPAYWEMNNFTFKTTAGTAVNFADSGTADKPVDINIHVIGTNTITSGDQNTGYSSVGMRFSGSNANVTISGAGTGAKNLCVTSGEGTNNYSSTDGIYSNAANLTFKNLNATFTGNDSTLGGWSVGIYSSSGNITIGDEAEITCKSEEGEKYGNATGAIGILTKKLKIEGTGILKASCINTSNTNTKAVSASAEPDAKAVATDTTTELTWDTWDEDSDTYYYKDQKNVATNVTLTVNPISVGEQTGTLAYGTAGSATYSVIQTPKTPAFTDYKVLWKDSTGAFVETAPTGVSASLGTFTDGVATLTITTTTKTLEGKHKFKVTAKNGSEDITSAEATLTIMLDLQWTEVTQTYNGKELNPKAKINGYPDVPVTVDKWMSKKINAGTYTATASSDNSNYTFFSNPTTEFVIAKCPVTFTVTGNYIKTGESGTPKVTASPAAAQFTLTYGSSAETAAAEVPTTAGTYGIYATLTEDTAKNYCFADNTTVRTQKIGTLTVADAEPVKYTLTYDVDGGTPIASVEDYSGTLLTLPTEDLLKKSGFILAGWQYDGKVYQAGETFTLPARNVTLTAKWETGNTVTGTVSRDGEKIGGAVVTLMSGSKELETVTTGKGGTFEFLTAVPDGCYQVMVSYSRQKKADVVEVKGTSVTANIALPANANQSTSVEVASGAPAVVVQNLETNLPDTGAANVKMTVETVQPEGAIASMDNVGLCMEITLKEDKTETEIKESKGLLTITIPLPGDLQGKAGYCIYREHDSEVQTITTMYNAAGEYCELNSDRTALIAHVKYFSTYAVGYNMSVESKETVTPIYSGDSSNRATSYSVQTETEGIGTVSVDKQFAIAGNKVTFTADPLPGWTLEGVTAKDENGTEVTLTEDAESGKYIFHMPAGNVVISVHFANPIATTQDTTEDTAQPSTEDTTPDTVKATAQDTICSGFSDVDVDAWYHAGVHFCLEKGYMNGVETTLFAPDDTLSRSMIVTMLWRMLGSPVANCAMSFADIPSDEWYTEAIRWAQSAGVVQGYDDTTFGPNDPVTREELAAILYRIAEIRGEGFTGASMFPFNPVDGATISDWAQEPMRWCCMTGILNGDDTGALRPIGDSTRAEAANMVQRFCEAIAE